MEDVIRRVGGMTESRAVEELLLAVSRMADPSRIRDSVDAELRNAPVVEARVASPRRVDATAILGVRRRPVSDDEEEPATPAPVRHMRSRSPSYDEDPRRRYLRGT